MNIQNMFSRAVFELKKYSPEIMLATGVVLGAVTIAEAVKYGIKVERTGLVKRASNLKDLDEETRKEELRELALEFAKPAIPVLLSAVGSAGAFYSSYRILNNRYEAAAIALTSVTQAYAKYMEKNGGLLAAYGGTETTDADGNKSIQTELTEAGLEPNGLKKTGTGFGFVWDKFSAYWKPDRSTNAAFIIMMERYLNDLLRGRGHLFLNEIHDAFDVERTSEGAIVGWASTKEDPEPFVQLTPIYRGDSIIIETNVSGVIYKKI